MPEPPLSSVAAEIARIRELGTNLCEQHPGFEPLVQVVMDILDEAFDHAASVPVLYLGEMPWWSDMKAAR